MEQTKSLSLFFLTFISMTMAITTAIDPPSSTTTTAINFIKTSCNTTTYPSVCLTSLLPYANDVKSNPIQLVKQALSATIKSTSAATSKLVKAKNTNSHLVVLNDCIEELYYSIVELTDSLKEVSSLGSNVNEKFAILSKAQNSTSAAITYMYGCVDQLSYLNLHVALKNRIKSILQIVGRMGSNALYLINNLNI